MDSVSRLSGSASVPLSDGPRVFCVVCGTFNDDMVLRQSGLKCRRCVGKSSNKHYARLQKRQATQFLSQTYSARSSAARLDTASFVHSGDGFPETQNMSSTTSSSVLPPPEGCSSSSAMPQTRNSSLRPIEEYISGTSVYRTAVKSVCRSSDKDRAADKSCSGDQGTLLGGGRSTKRSTSDTLSKVPQNSARAQGSNLNSSSVAGDAIQRSSVPPAQPPTAGSTQHQQTNSTSDSSDVVRVPLNRGVSETSPESTPAHGTVRCSRLPTTGAKNVSSDPVPFSKAAPLRLPPRNKPHAKGWGTSSPPVSVADTTKRSAERKAATKSHRKVMSATHVKTTTASPSPPRNTSAAAAPRPGTKMTSITVRCIADEEVMSESWSGACSGGAVVPVVPTDPCLSHPSTPNNGVAISPAVNLSQHFAYRSPMKRGEGQRTSSFSLAASPDASSNPPAPRAGSCIHSSTSSTIDFSSHSRLQGSKSRTKSNASTLRQRGSPHLTQCSNLKRRLAASVSHVDPHETASREASLLLCMPRASGGAALAVSGSGQNSTSSDSESSSSQEPCATSVTPPSSSLSSVVVSSDSPEAVANPPRPAAAAADATATTEGADTKKAWQTGTNAPNVHPDKDRRKRKKKTTARGEDGASDVFAAKRLSGSIDALRITVELVSLAPNVPEASTSISRGGDGQLPTGTSSNDESSAGTDSTRSVSSRANDGYHRQVYAGGQSGGFTVTRHIRQRSGGSDLLTGASGGAPSSLASGKSKAAPQRSRQQRSSFGEAIAMGVQEVKKITYCLILHHRSTGEVLLRQKRRLYPDIIPACERVKMAAGAGLPAVPVKRLPSLRFATEAFMEERRAEVEAFLQAVSQSPSLIRHPDMVKLLGLAPYVTDVAVTTATGAASVSDSRGNRTDHHRYGRSTGAIGSGVSPPSESYSTPGRRQRERAGVVGHSQQCHHHSKSDGPGFDAATAVSDRDEPGAGYTVRVNLTEGALNAYRTSATESGGGGGCGDFYRTPSYSSLQTTTSSVVRRRKLDDVTMEDLEHIQLGNLIGRGTFGSVYLGLLQTHRGPLMVAVKVMTISETVTPVEIEGLQRELDVLSTAQHKNIIRFLGSSLNTATRELRVFTEYVECGTIRSLVHRFGALTMLAIQQYMRQILSGLQHLHSLSIAHRDIKGENILVTKNGRVKLSDFGSSTGTPCDASTAADASSLPLSSGGGGGLAGSVAGDSPLVGSPQYMAPEVIQGTVKSYAAADMWSLGCVGIEMLDRIIWRETAGTNPYAFLYRISRSGTPPHGLPTDAELAALKAEGNMKEYEGFSLYLDFLRRCLCVDWEQRQTASDQLKHPFMTYPYSKHLRWMPPATVQPSAVKPS
ncbi:hypothetical protein JKF63_06455 [Porcisia hertigi]|uniref:Protein kinase domain-containing protein n=1 Tax=Porcisia hertigi TaxID=2761500 RepID=A0A836LJY9_9TRYP|nr:hypothetical protein JKF63_06455 [Porcisia hertigi]